jgi:polyisoprenoid-binding protein YceI
MNTLRLVATTALLSLSTFSFAQVKWAVDPAHTNTRFSVNHLGISMVDGQFKKLEGNVETKNKTDFNGASIQFDIDVNSVDTRVEARDNHLKTNDFFDAAQYPKMTLTHATLKKVKGNAYTLTGTLTIKDVSKKVTFKVVQNGGIITDPWGKTRAGFTASTTINRFDYHLQYNDKLPSGTPAVGANINIEVNTELVMQ